MKKNTPDNVTGFSISVINDTPAVFSWDKNADRGLAYYEVRYDPDSVTKELFKTEHLARLHAVVQTIAHESE